MNPSQEAKAEIAKRILGRRSLENYIKYTDPKYEFTDFHKNYIKIIEPFAKGTIKKLIVTVPPQHGKSEISSRKLPSYLLGKNPDLRLAISSFNMRRSRSFSKDIRRVMKEPEYINLFPETRIPTRSDTGYTDTQEEFQIVGKDGSIKASGRGTALTGDPVDIWIGDDLYKDSMEANSPTIRQNVIEWYTQVVRSRLHNNSQQLIVFTRWHEEDLIGFIEANEDVQLITSLDQLEDPDDDIWYKINFQALKEGDKTEIDPREQGEALWEGKHSRKKHQKEKKLDPISFACLHQGDPQPREGLLYSGFKTYKKLPDQEEAPVCKFYCDVADTGNDWLYIIFWKEYYAENGKKELYIVDVYGSSEQAEETEYQVSKRIIENGADQGWFESNNGGRSYARNVQRIVSDEMGYTSVSVDWFHQSGNKEARIISNQSNLQKYIYMPEDWKTEWPDFYLHLIRFKRDFKSNKHDDAPDTLTGVFEKSQDSDLSVMII